jgi:hypothetical protein
MMEERQLAFLLSKKESRLFNSFSSKKKILGNIVENQCIFFPSFLLQIILLDWGCLSVVRFGRTRNKFTPFPPGVVRTSVVETRHDSAPVQIGWGLLPHVL